MTLLSSLKSYDSKEEDVVIESHGLTYLNIKGVKKKLQR